MHDAMMMINCQSSESTIRRLRARRALTLVQRCFVQNQKGANTKLCTAIAPFWLEGCYRQTLYSNCALLVLNGTSLNVSINDLLALSRRIVVISVKVHWPSCWWVCLLKLFIPNLYYWINEEYEGLSSTNVVLALEVLWMYEQIIISDYLVSLGITIIINLKLNWLLLYKKNIAYGYVLREEVDYWVMGIWSFS